MAYDPTELFTPYYQNIQAGLAGQLPKDVTDQIMRGAAEYGIKVGMPGSQLAGYQGLRNLGLTSLDQQRWAANQFQPNVRAALDYGTWLDKWNIQQGEAERERQLALQARNQDIAMQNWRNRGPFTPPIVSQGGYAMQPQRPQQGMSRGGLNTNQMLSGLIGKYGGTASSPLNYQEQPTDTGPWYESSDYWGMSPESSAGSGILGSVPNMYMSPDTITAENYGFGGLTAPQVSAAENPTPVDVTEWNPESPLWGYGGA